MINALPLLLSWEIIYPRNSVKEAALIMRNPELMTVHGVGESLSVLYNNDNCNVITILDTIEDASSSSELVTKLNSLKLLNKFTLDRENSEYVRLVTTDYLGNRHYLKAQK